jgi:carboxypeptidase Q
MRFFSIKQHMNDLKHWSLAMESDLGTFTPTGLSYSGTNTTAQCIVNEVLQLLKPINATELIIGVDGSDVLLFNDKGVPISGLQNKNDKYFYFHHSEGDTMTVEDKHVLDLCLTFWTATSYVFASIDDILPR